MLKQGSSSVFMNEKSLNFNVKHVMITLFGNFKNDESIERCHLLTIVYRSKSILGMEN